MKKILMLLLFVSCSSRKPIIIQTDTFETNNYIKNFLLKHNIKTDTPIVFRDTDKKYVAICKQYENKKLNIIHINKKDWMSRSDAQKKLTLIHEIGHCDKYLDHNDELMEDKCPVSIMHHQIFSSECFNKHEKMYRQQVFGKE